MKKTLALLALCMVAGLAIIAVLPSYGIHAAPPIKPKVRKTGPDCATAATGFPGKVFGRASSVAFSAGMVAGVGGGPYTLTYQDCDSPTFTDKAVLAAFGIKSLASISAIESVSSFEPGLDSITNKEMVRLGGFSLLGGIIKFTGFQCSVETTGTATTATSKNTSTWGAVTILGKTISVGDPAPNTVIGVPGLGTVTFNKQTITGDGVNTSNIDLVGLEIKVLEPDNAFNIPVGAVFQTSHLESHFTRDMSIVPAIAVGRSPYFYGYTGPGYKQFGPTNDYRADPEHPYVTSLGFEATMPLVGSVGAWGGNAKVTISPEKNEGFVTGGLGRVKLFNGLITMNTLTATAKATMLADGTGSTEGTANLGGLLIAGKQIGGIPAPNFNVDIPGLGHAIINKQIVKRTQTGISIETISLDIEVTIGSLTGLHFTIGHAIACANIPGGAPTPAPTSAPTQAPTPTMAPTMAPSPTPCRTPRPADIHRKKM